MGYIIIVIKRSECIIYVIAIALTIPSPIHMNILIWLIVYALQHPSVIRVDVRHIASAGIMLSLNNI